MRSPYDQSRISVRLKNMWRRFYYWTHRERMEREARESLWNIPIFDSVGDDPAFRNWWKENNKARDLPRQRQELIDAAEEVRAEVKKATRRR